MLTKYQNMTGYREVASSVPEKQRSKPAPRRPSADFGRIAVELAASVGKNKQDLAKAAGRTGGPKDATINRLARGEGSLALAIDVRDALERWGADISKLPALPVGEDSLESMPDRLRAWVSTGEELLDVASPERFDVELERVREVIRAHHIVADGTRERHGYGPKKS